LNAVGTNRPDASHHGLIAEQQRASRFDVLVLRIVLHHQDFCTVPHHLHEHVEFIQAMPLIWDPETSSLFAAIISFWFGSRALGNAAGTATLPTMLLLHVSPDSSTGTRERSNGVAHGNNQSKLDRMLSPVTHDDLHEWTRRLDAVVDKFADATGTLSVTIAKHAQRLDYGDKMIEAIQADIVVLTIRWTRIKRI
jgi:hypothetical protein